MLRVKYLAIIFALTYSLTTSGQENKKIISNLSYTTSVGMSLYGGNTLYYTDNKTCLSLLNGVEYLGKYSLNAGVGITRISYNDIVPLSLNLQVAPFNSKISPFLSFSGGTLLQFNSDNNYYGQYIDKGHTFNLSLGTLCKINENFSMFSTLGYNYFKVFSRYTYWEGEGYTQIDELNRIDLTIGLKF